MTEPNIDVSVSHDTVCVLYAADSGDVIYTHRVVTLGDAEPQSDEEIQADARRLMEDVPELEERRSAGEVAALMVSPAELQPGRRYGIDLEKRAVVERARPTAE
jgi:hypothetical protein